MDTASSPPSIQPWRGRPGLRLPHEALRRGLALSRPRAIAAAELLAIVIWAALFTGPYLDLSPSVMPAGREYAGAIQSHHVWERLRDCGACALWNGSQQGGSPALTDPYSSMLHPLVILTTLGWGVLNGSKIALGGGFAIAGLAQWWLARALGVGRVARLWSAALAVVAGHLAGRMELGLFGIVLSASACALVLAPLITLSRTGARRDAAVLGLALGLALVSGQGYMQTGLAFTLPAALLLLPSDAALRRRVLVGALLAGAIALLLAAPLLAPFARVSSMFVKLADPGFPLAQPLPHVLTNLLISDPAYFYSDVLHAPYPFLYVNYVGLTPLLLAGLGLAQAGRRPWRPLAFLAASAALAFWLASAEPLRMVEGLPFDAARERVAGLRNISMVATLAVPPLLALAAVGVDVLLGLRWGRLRLTIEAGASRVSLALGPRWLVLIPLALALHSAWAFSRGWITTAVIGDDTLAILESLRTPDLQWVSPPFGEAFFVEPAIARGLKLSTGFQPWSWRDRPLPEAVREVSWNGPPADMREEALLHGETRVYVATGREYAAVTADDGRRTVCEAHGVGGDLDVVCDAAHGGRLTVQENAWADWYARVDGAPAALADGPWLALELPPGRHLVTLSYRPWDVPLGVALALAGLALALWQLRPQALAPR